MDFLVELTVSHLEKKENILSTIPVESTNVIAIFCTYVDSTDLAEWNLNIFDNLRQIGIIGDLMSATIEKTFLTRHLLARPILPITFLLATTISYQFISEWVRLKNDFFIVRAKLPQSNTMHVHTQESQDICKLCNIRSDIF